MDYVSRTRPDFIGLMVELTLMQKKGWRAEHIGPSSDGIVTDATIYKKRNQWFLFEYLKDGNVTISFSK